MESLPNEVIRQLMERKSVRVFEERPIAESDARLILEAACQAPTAGNQQLYTILDIRGMEKKHRLSILCDNQPFIEKAPLVLVFLADVRRWLDTYAAAGVPHRPAGVGDLLLAVSDANIAAQNAVTAAWSLGIGSCYIGDVMERCEDIRALLWLPEMVFPAAMLVFGYPTAQQRERTKPQRSPLETIVKQDVYSIRDTAELRAMTAKDYPQTTFEDWCRRFCDRKYNSGFAREMTRSVAQYLKDYEADDV